MHARQYINDNCIILTKKSPLCIKFGTHALVMNKTDKSHGNSLLCSVYIGFIVITIAKKNSEVVLNSISVRRIYIYIVYSEITEAIGFL